MGPRFLRLVKIAVPLQKKSRGKRELKIMGKSQVSTGETHDAIT